MTDTLFAKACYHRQPPRRRGRGEVEGYRRHTKPAEPTASEKARVERLRRRHDELAYLDKEHRTDELIEEAGIVAMTSGRGIHSIVSGGQRALSKR